MATTERYTTAGVLPAVNDIAALAAVLGAYVTRFGIVAEEVAGVWWHLPLILTTDVILPLLGAVWLLAMPTYGLWQRYRDE